MNLLDVNVWVAGIWERHVHHAAVRRWRDTADEPHALTRRDAWTRMLALQRSSDVIWADEPDALEDTWRLLWARDERDYKLWTDDYLAAFAQAAGMRLVTLDAALARRYPSVEVVAI